MPRGQPASRARSPHQAIDWLQRSKRLEGSAEAFVLTLTNTQTEVPWPYSWHNDDQPVSASSTLSAALCGPVLTTMEATLSFLVLVYPTSETEVEENLTDFAGYYCTWLMSLLIYGIYTRATPHVVIRSICKAPNLIS